MLTAVHIYNSKGVALELPMDAITSEALYLIREIEGLGPVNANIVTSSFVTMDGGIYQNGRGAMRNVVLKLGFNPSYDTEDPYGELRRALYPFLTPKMKVVLRFLSSNFETVQLVGYVESFEPSIFSAEPEVQISIICPDPFFYSLQPIAFSLTGSGEYIFTNPGTADSGLVFTLTNFQSAGNYGLRMTKYEAPDGLEGPTIGATEFPYVQEMMNYVGAFYAQGDPLVLQVTTTKGKKAARWTNYEGYDPQDPLWYGSVLGYIDGWFEVHPGYNRIHVDISGSNTPNAPSTLVYTPRYVGL